MVRNYHEYNFNDIILSNNNSHKSARVASVIIYKIYRFREAGRRAGEKKERIHKIYKISLACEQEFLNVNVRNVLT